MDRMLFPSRQEKINPADTIRLIQSLPYSHSTLKQWSVFNAVVSCGSFASAANLLNMSQPGVSYIIAKLEEQIGLQLLKVEGRKARMTENGMCLMLKSHNLIKEAVDLELTVNELRNNRGNTLKLAVNEEFPAVLLFHALRTFNEQSRGPSVTLIQSSSEKIDCVLRDRLADLAIAADVPEGLEAEVLAEISYLPVAHPEHRLFKLGRPLTAADLADEVQILYESSASVAPGRDRIKHTSSNRWMLRTIDAAAEAIGEGLGYGWLPEHRVALAANRRQFQVLPIDCGAARLRFYLIHGRASASMPGIRHLATVLQHEVMNRLSFIRHIA